jgi:glycosyltransferase involved in cell wall biosynthesis
VAVGEDVRQTLITVEGFPPDRVEVIYNGIDLSAFDNPGRDRREARRELGLADGDVALIQVARLHPLKDHATALRALARVVRQRPDVRLVVVGAGPQEAAIARQVRELGLGPFVRLLGRRHDVPRLLGAADLALLSSRSEGIPLALIEAMAAGLPAVATRVGGIPEVVEEGITGALAPAGDDEALAAQILRLVGDPAARAGLAASARRRAFDRFGDDRMLAAYGRAYREMTGRRPGSV